MRVLIELDVATAAFAHEQVVEVVTKAIHEGDTMLTRDDKAILEEIEDVKLMSQKPYDMLVSSFVEFIMEVELAVESDRSLHEDKVDLDHLDGQYIAERVAAESDLMNDIAAKVKERIKLFRNLKE